LLIDMDRHEQRAFANGCVSELEDNLLREWTEASDRIGRLVGLGEIRKLPAKFRLLVRRELVSPPE
jgi:hypothetical protein